MIFMNTPNWYMPALCDAVLDSLDNDAAIQCDNFRLVARYGSIKPEGVAEWQRFTELRELIRREKVNRQTVRLASASKA